MGTFGIPAGQERLERYRKSFVRHTLEEHGAAPARVFILRPPGGGHMESTTIVFTGGRSVASYIAVLGDLCPGTNGVVSDAGYDVGWFARRISDDHLCSKFLRKVYVPELAVDALRDQVKQLRKDTNDEDLDTQYRDTARQQAEQIEEALAEDEEAVTGSYEAFDELWREVFDDGAEESGFGYDLRDATLLVAIQETFARLYQAAHPPAAEVDSGAIPAPAPPPATIPVVLVDDGAVLCLPADTMVTWPANRARKSYELGSFGRVLATGGDPVRLPDGRLAQIEGWRDEALRLRVEVARTAYAAPAQLHRTVPLLAAEADASLASAPAVEVLRG